MDKFEQLKFILEDIKKAKNAFIMMIGTLKKNTSVKFIIILDQ